MRYFGAPRGHVRQIRSRPDPLTRDKSAPKAESAGPSQSSYRALIFDRGFLRKTAAAAHFGPESAWDSWNIRKQVNRLGAFNSPKYIFQLDLVDLRSKRAVFQSSSLPEIPAKSACAVVLSGPDARRRGTSAPEHRNAGERMEHEADREIEKRADHHGDHVVLPAADRDFRRARRGAALERDAVVDRPAEDS